MAKKKNFPKGSEVQKLTNKQILWSLQQNVNDEGATGFKQLSNVNLHPQSGAVIQRDGLVQSGLLGYKNLGNVFTLPAFAGLPAAPVNYSQFNDDVLGITSPMFIFQSTQTVTVQSITLMLSRTAGSLPPGPWPSIQLREYDPDLQRFGPVVGILNSPAGETILASPTPTPFTFTLQTGSCIIRIGITYAIQIVFPVPAYYGTGNQDITIQMQVGDTAHYSLAGSATFSGKSTVYRIGNFFPVTTITATKVVGNGIYGFQLKQILCPTGLSADRVFSATYTPAGLPQDSGILYAYPPSLENTINMTGTGNLLPAVNTVNGFSTALQPAYLYPTCYYGHKIVQNVHQFLIGLGSNLPGKNATAQSYQITKRAKGDTGFTFLTPNVFFNTYPTAVAFQRGAGGDFAWATASGDAGTYIREGRYEYAIEYIDKTGYSYETEIPDGTIRQVATPNAATTDLNVAGAQNTAALNGLAPGAKLIKFGELVYGVNITVPPPAGPYPGNGWLNYPIVNIYRRVTQNVQEIAGQYSVLYTPDSPFMLVSALNSTPPAAGYVNNITQPGWSWNAASQVWTYADGVKFYPATDPHPGLIAGATPMVTSTTELSRKDYYIPKAVDIDVFNGKLIAVGDPAYQNVIFPARDLISDFYVDDEMIVTFPPGDTYFTAVKVHGMFCYIFSKHGTWLLRQTSTVAPFFYLQQINSKLGCISTSKGIIQAGNILLVPTAEGLQMFDGASYRPIDQKINDIFHAIDYTEHPITTTGSPSITTTHIPAFTLEGIYDYKTTNAVWLMPPDNQGNRAIYVYNMDHSCWFNFTIPDVKGIFFDAVDNKVKLITSQYIMSMEPILTQDCLTDGGYTQTPIGVTIETTDIDFQEKTTYKSLRVWGTGTISIDVYIDRAATTTIHLDNVVLDTYGAKGIQIGLGWIGNFYRFKITSSSGPVEIKGYEVLYANQGVKMFDQVS